MEEEIEIIEDNIDEFMDVLYETYRQSKVKPFEKAIEHLISAYKKLEEENKELQEKWDRDCYKIDEMIREEYKIKTDYIPKSVIEEKIEEVQEKYEETLKNADFKEITTMNKINFEGIKLEGQRAVLQELLEERNK